MDKETRNEILKAKMFGLNFALKMLKDEWTREEVIDNLERYIETLEEWMEE